MTAHDHSWAETTEEVEALCPDYNPDIPAGIRCPGDNGSEDGTGELLTEDQRWQVEESRRVLASWDAERYVGEEAGYSTERALADQVRTLLAIVDAVAPKAEG